MNIPKNIDPETVEVTPTLGLTLETGMDYNEKYWARASSGFNSAESIGNNEQQVIGSAFGKLFKMGIEAHP